MNLTPLLSRVTAAGSEHLATNKRLVGFEVRLKRARAVWLLGIVGAWHPSFVRLINKGNGLWKKRIELAPGDFSYRLIVDGSCIDPAATVKIDDASRGTITRFFTIPRPFQLPRITAIRQRLNQNSRQTKHFLASDRSAHQCGSSRLREPRNLRRN